MQKFETTFEEILEKMTASAAKMDEAEKEFKDKDDDVNAAARRCVLMEGEATVSVEKLATTVMKLALMSKEADNIIKVLEAYQDWCSDMIYFRVLVTGNRRT